MPSPQSSFAAKFSNKCNGYNGNCLSTCQRYCKQHYRYQHFNMHEYFMNRVLGFCFRNFLENGVEIRQDNHLNMNQKNIMFYITRSRLRFISFIFIYLYLFGNFILQYLLYIIVDQHIHHSCGKIGIWRVKAFIILYAPSFYVRIRFEKLIYLCRQVSFMYDEFSREAQVFPEAQFVFHEK